MSGHERPPDSLRRAVAADLAPRAPLAHPARRVLAVVPLALALLVLAPAVFSLRSDASRLGFPLAWGASFLETMLGIVIVAAALREAVPGTTLPRRAIVAIAAIAVASVAIITLATWRVSPTPPLRHPLGFVWRVCVLGTFTSALPPLAVALLMIRRAYALRPALAGALCGLGSGLLADAGWRMFCHYTDPGHVLGAHALGIALVVVTGAGIGRRAAIRRQLRTTNS